MSVTKSRALQHLHELLQQVHDVEQALDHGPKRIAVLQQKAAAAEQACADQKAQIQLLKKTVDQNSLNLKSREAAIQKLTGRLNQASSNKEYDIVQAQIANEKSADAKLEDTILSLLSQIDEANDELASREAEVARTHEKASAVTADVKARESDLTAEAERLYAEVREAEKSVPGGESNATYKRLRAAQGAGAMARLDDGFCAECNTAATQQDVVRLNTNEFVLCRACGRILYQVVDEDE